jgi:isocitrate/isopropylmalate dehydrogenase
LKTKICLIKGDGIGPEIADSVLKILDAARSEIEWIEIEAGLGAIEKTGHGISLLALQTQETSSASARVLGRRLVYDATPDLCVRD